MLLRIIIAKSQSGLSHAHDLAYLKRKGLEGFCRAWMEEVTTIKTATTC